MMRNRRGKYRGKQSKRERYIEVKMGTFRRETEKIWWKT